MFKDEGIAETKPRDAGAAPSAPAVGPLMNVSQTTQPEEGNRLPGVGDTTADAESPRETLLVPDQGEPSTTQTMDNIPVLDAGPARAHLMTDSVSTSVKTEH